MKTLNLKTIATATLVIFASLLASCNQNEPEKPGKTDTTPATGNYLAAARLTVNDSVMAFVESVQVKYTLPGEAEKIETLSFRPLQSSDPEVKMLENSNIDPAIGHVAAFEKSFKQSGEVKMQLILHIDTTRATYAEKYEALILPLLAAGEPKGADKYAALKAESNLYHNGGIRADRFMEYLQRSAESLDETSFSIR